jgi:hypothetical protein
MKPDEDWTDEELEEYDRRTAEKIAQMSWFDVKSVWYTEIDHLLSPQDMWIADEFRKHRIRGFFQSETYIEALFTLNELNNGSQNVHIGFHQRMLFMELMRQEAMDQSVAGIQYNIDARTAVGVKGPYRFHGEIDWSQTHFICQVSLSRNRPVPDFILIFPIPNLFPLGSSFN